MSEKGFRIEIPVTVRADRSPRKVDRSSIEDTTHRAARLLALGHKWENWSRRGRTSYSQLANLHGVSVARVSQIAALALLPPNIQERLLLPDESAPPSPSGHSLRPFTRRIEWDEHDQ